MHSATFGENQTYQHQLLVSAVKHGDRGVMVWACFVVTEPGRFAVIELTICLTVKAWPKLAYAEEQSQICNRIAKKERNQCVEIT